MRVRDLRVNRRLRSGALKIYIFIAIMLYIEQKHSPKKGKYSKDTQKIFKQNIKSSFGRLMQVPSHRVLCLP